MKKETKIKLLEFLILITIIVSVFTIGKLAKEYLDTQVNESTSNKTENYTANKITLYYLDIEKANIYNIPYFDKIDKENSKYERYIKSSDNIINGLEETIIINYLQYEEIEVEEENEEETEEENEEPAVEKVEIQYNMTDLINFCNKYNEIEHDYKFTCQIQGMELTLNNSFNIPISSIRESKKKIDIDIEEGQKLSSYLKILDEQNIEHFTVNGKQKKHQ